MKAYVLLSGGIDSTTCLAIADRECEQITGVSIDYGQRHSKEMQYARYQCDMILAEHRIISLAGVVPKTMLTNPDEKIPDISYDEIIGVSPTFVPFRNGLMLAAIASLASGELSIDVDNERATIYFGAHAEDAHNWAYPDCTPEFIGAMANAIYIGSYAKVRLSAPLMNMRKDEIIKVADGLGVNLAETWSCYAGGQLHCGTCPTCRARKQAFEKAKVVDLTEYAA